MQPPNQRQGQHHRRHIRDHIDRRRCGRRNWYVQARPRRLGVPRFVDRGALADGHDRLGGAVGEDDGGDDPAGDHEVLVAAEDAAVEEQGGEFDERGREGVGDFEADEALGWVVLEFGFWYIL